MIEIPDQHNPKRYIVSRFIDEEFVEVRCNDKFDVRMQYPILKMKNAESSCLVRGEVYARLNNASSLLPDGYRLRIWDAWRSFKLQDELYEIYSDTIIKKFGLQKKSDINKTKIIRKYVSEPIEDRDVPPVHTTGGAVDVTIIDDHNQELNMGTFFDEFTEMTKTAYFEKGLNDTVKNNRKLLYYVMTASGFTNLPSEWWHFDYGDRFWAYYNSKPAKYRGVFRKEDINGV